MYKKMVSATVVAFITIYGMAMSPDILAGKKSIKHSICEKTAGLMHSACKADSKDDLNTSLANCLNILDSDESSECMQEARGNKKEEDENCKDVRHTRQDACELLAENAYDPNPLLDPANEFIDPDDVPGIFAPNPYVSIAAGHTYVLRTGEDEEETVIVHVTRDNREIQGVCKPLNSHPLNLNLLNSNTIYRVLVLYSPLPWKMVR